MVSGIGTTMKKVKLMANLRTLTDNDRRALTNDGYAVIVELYDQLQAAFNAIKEALLNCYNAQEEIINDGPPGYTRSIQRTETDAQTLLNALIDDAIKELYDHAH